MTNTNLAESEMPTAMPGVEDDDLREKLLHDEAIEPRNEIGDDEEESIENETNIVHRKSKGRVLKALAGFAIFLCLLIVAICWFFEIALFSKQKAQPVGRNASKDSQTQPVTEDEKLKMALNMVAEKEPVIGNADNDPGVAETNELVRDERIPDTVLDDNSKATTFNSGRQTTNGIGSMTNEFKDSDGLGLSRTNTNLGRTTIGETRESVSSAKPTLSNATEPPGKSIFFGRDVKSAKQEPPQNNFPRAIFNVETKIPLQNALRIPFGTLMPVRIVGSFYTFRSSGGFVRMELTRQVEGNGYKFPAGTIVVGNVRGGESTRAFVTVVGLIEPSSGNLINFTGELLGRDGGSGIEGRKRKLSSGWSRVLRGLKETAGTILSGAGAFRSGGTLVISDSIRRGGDSIAGEISDSLSGNRDRDGFIEVAAGSNGYVLVSDLPNNDGASKSQLKNAYPSGLSDEELAAVLTGNSQEDWQTLIPKMTPEFRRLAEQAIAGAASGNAIGGIR